MSDSIADLVSLLGKETMLRTVLRVKDINEDLFLNMINKRINTDCQMEGLEYDFYQPDAPLNLLVKTACPVSILFRDELARFYKKNKKKTGETVNTYIIGGCDTTHEFENLWKAESIDNWFRILLCQCPLMKYMTSGLF